MLVTVKMTKESRKAIEALGKQADDVKKLSSKAIVTAAAAGAEDIKANFIMGKLAIKPQRPAAGIAASIGHWVIDDQTAALGIPVNAPAHVYAGIHERGGVIRPKKAKALAIPLTREAKRFGGPRQQAAQSGTKLFVLQAKSKAFLAEQKTKSRLVFHWLLKKSVTIPKRQWFTLAVKMSLKVMRQAFNSVMSEAFKGGK